MKAPPDLEADLLVGYGLAGREGRMGDPNLLLPEVVSVCMVGFHQVFLKVSQRGKAVRLRMAFPGFPPLK